MSKLGKIFLGCALPLLLAGGVTAYAGWHMGAERTLKVRWDGYEFSLNPFGMTGWNDDRASYSGDWSHQNLGAAELPAFQKLDVDLAVGDLTVETGDEPSLGLSWYGEGYALHTSDKNGLLKIWSTSSVKNSGSCDAVVVLTLPAGTALSGVTVSSDVGDVNLYGLEIGRLDVDSDVGDVALTGLTLGEADIGLVVGGLTAELRSLTGRLTASSDVGDISLYGALSGDADLSTDVGGVTLYPEGARSSYRWDLSTGMGSVWLDGEDMGGDRVEGGSGAHMLTVKAGMNDINVLFGGEGPESEGRPAHGAEEVADLPKELYKYCPEYEDKDTGFRAGVLQYDFTVEEATVMTIDVEHWSGKLELGIKNRVGFGWPYDQRAFDTESDSVELAPGQYTLSIHAEAFQGSYRVTGEEV